MAKAFDLAPTCHKKKKKRERKKDLGRFFVLIVLDSSSFDY